MASERAPQQAFLGASALLFAASAAVTIVWCGSMSAMDGMPMPGGSTLSWRQPSPPNVSHRPVSAPRESLEPSSSGQGCF